MTAYQTIYDAFLSQVQDDEWTTWEQWEREEDWKQLLSAALPWFKFPRFSLEMGEEGFIDTLSNVEIQIIAAFMKYIWVERMILSWENMRPLYSERDFSPASMLDKFRQQQENQLKAARKLESIYYRSIDGKPFSYSRLAGG